MKKLSINECSQHGYMSVSIDDERGGLRLTDSKCCGAWKIIRQWKIDDRMIGDICSELGLRRLSREEKDASE